MSHVNRRGLTDAARDVHPPPPSTATSTTATNMSNGASSSTADWQRLWEHAQPRLNTIRDSLNEQMPPLARITRVGKLDAELLDHELVTLLQEPIGKALALINVSFEFPKRFLF